MPQCSSGVDPESSLGWLLAPLTVETFLTEIWGQSHYHVSRNCPEYFDTLFGGSASVDQLLGLFRPDLSLVRLVRKNGEALHYLSKSTEPFRVCDLPGLPEAQQIDLARTLIVNGFLVRLPGD